MAALKDSGYGSWLDSSDISVSSDANMRSVDSLTRIPTPLHTHQIQESSIRNLKDLRNQMMPLFLHIDFPGFFGDYEEIDQRMLQIEHVFLRKESALRLLRRAFPNALVYQRAREKVLANWETNSDYISDPEDIIGWQFLSEQNGVALFGREQWLAARRHIDIEMLERSNPYRRMRVWPLPEGLELTLHEEEKSLPQSPSREFNPWSDDWRFIEPQTEEKSLAYVDTVLVDSTNTADHNLTKSSNPMLGGTLQQSTGEILAQWGYPRR